MLSLATMPREALAWGMIDHMDDIHYEKLKSVDIW